MDFQTAHPLFPNSNQNLHKKPINTVNTHATHHREKTNKKAMEKFHEIILKLAETRPNAPLTPSHKTLLRDRLNGLFSEYQTPDHPPYSAMIERALRELNEEGGSTEDAICKFVRKEHHNLPWAHRTLLKHHLGKLCESGDIVVTRHKRYMIVGENTSLKSIKKWKRKTRKRKWRWDWERQKERRRKKRNQQKGGKVELTGKYLESEEQEQQLTEKVVHGEEKQNKGMLSANEMEHSEDTRSQQPEIKLPETMKGDICSARVEENQEGEQATDNQSELSSPERPPGFESIRVENLSRLKIYLNKDFCLREQSIVVGKKELHDLPLSSEILNSPGDLSDHDLSKPRSLITHLENYQPLDDDGHQPARVVPVQELTVDRTLMHEKHQPETLNAEGQEKRYSVRDNIVDMNSKRDKNQGQRRQRNFWKKEMITGDVPVSYEQTTKQYLPELSTMKHSEGLEIAGLEQGEYKLPSKIAMVSSRRHNNSKKLNEKDRPNLSIPEGPSGLGLVLAEESSGSKRTQRQLRRWSLPVLKAVNSTKVGTSSKSEDHQSLHLKLSNLELPQDQQKEPVSTPTIKQQSQEEEQQSECFKADLLDVVQSVVIERKHKEAKIYGRRRKTKSEQLQLQREILQDKPSSGRILRARIKKPKVINDGNATDVLQPEHEECLQTVHKHRGMPAKQKAGIGVSKSSSPSLRQEMKELNQQSLESIKTASMDESQKLREFQRRQSSLKPKPDVRVVGNIKLMDHQSSQDLQQSAVPADCGSLSEKVEATRTNELLLLRDFISSRKQKLLDEQPKPRRPKKPPKCQ